MSALPPPSFFTWLAFGVAAIFLSAVAWWTAILVVQVTRAM